MDTKNKKLLEKIARDIERYKADADRSLNLMAITVETYREENDRLRETLQIIAAPKRADGTYNRSREACEQLAKQAILNLPMSQNTLIAALERLLSIVDPTRLNYDQDSVAAAIDQANDALDEYK